MLIRYAMTSPATSVLADTSLAEAARHMADARVGALPVVDDDRVIGVITDRDLVVRGMACGLSPGLRVETVMSADPVTVEADTPVAAALHAMRSVEVRHLPVTERGRLVGMVSFDDLFWHAVVQLTELAAVVGAARRVPEPFPARRAGSATD